MFSMIEVPTNLFSPALWPLAAAKSSFLQLKIQIKFFLLRPLKTCFQYSSQALHYPISLLPTTVIFEMLCKKRQVTCHNAL